MYISAIFKIVRQFFFLRNHGYHDRVVRRKYFVRETNRKKRLEFANNNQWNIGMVVICIAKSCLKKIDYDSMFQVKNDKGALRVSNYHL